MKDNLPRRCLKFLVRCVSTTDLAATRAIRRARGEKPHRLAGKCQLCAACCESPVIQTRGWLHHWPLARRAFLAWHGRVNGFELQKSLPAHGMFVFRCTHFDPLTRRCDSYDSRPLMCRDYPRTLLWDSDPTFLPGCGYSAISPRATEVGAMLDREAAHLSQEDRAALKRRLHAYDPEERSSEEED